MLHRRCSSSACQSACLGAPMLIIVTYVAAPRESSVSRDFGNMAGTWPEHGRNMAEETARCDTIHKRQGTAATARWGARERTPSFGNEPATGLERSLISICYNQSRGRARRVGGSTNWIMRLQPAIILQRTPYTRATPTVPWPYALNTFPPSEALADKSPRKPWEKRSAKSSAETQALCGRTWGQWKEAQGEQSICRPWRWTTS